MEFYDKLLELDKKYDAKIDKLSEKIENIKSDMSTVIAEQKNIREDLTNMKEMLSQINKKVNNIPVIESRLESLEKKKDWAYQYLIYPLIVGVIGGIIVSIFQLLLKYH